MLRENPQPEPALANPSVAEGMRWGLAAVLVIQVFLGSIAPSLLFTLLGHSRVSGVNALAVDPMPLVAGSIPWLVFLGAHLSHIRFLRRLGPYPYTDGQVVLMALLPGYNLVGSVELFASQGALMERLGGGRGLGLQLRAAGSAASGLAVAEVVLRARVLGAAVLDPSLAPSTAAPGTVRALLLVSLALLLVRLIVLSRLQLATRALLAAHRAGALPALEQRPGLPGARSSLAAVALTLVAGWIALALPPFARRDEPSRPVSSARAPGKRAAPARTAPETPPSPPPPEVAPVEPSPGPAKASTELAAAASAPPAPPVLPPGYLLGGRTLYWWQERLRSLRSRSDDAGQRLFELTRERASANGLVVTGDGGELRVEASSDRIAAALAEASD